MGDPTLPIPLTEEIRALSEWPKLLPTRRGGKRIHVSCLYRWALHGVYGVRLETLQVGGTTCTSREALERFFAALARSHRDGPPKPAARSATSTRRAREVAEASRLAREVLR
jgi:hypothetical protein